MRKSFDEYFLEIAEITAERSTCNRLWVGAVIAKDDRMISAGYNGSVKGHDHCTDNDCLKNDEGRCIRTIHAEVNALLFADRHLLEGATIYVTHSPCENCSKLIAQVGIKRIVYRHEYKNKYNHHFLKGIEMVHLKESEKDSN